MLDVQGKGESMGHNDSALLDKLIKIRERYPDLLKKKTAFGGGKIQSVLSKAVCEAKITEDEDEQALSIFREYLDAYLEM